MTDLMKELFEDINWNNVADAPPAVDSGEVHAKITKVDAFKSKTKQTPGLRVEAVIQSGKDVGRTINQNIWMTEKSRWAVKRFFGKRGLDIIPANGKPNFADAEGWEGIFKLTTKVTEESDFPDYRFVPLSAIE